MGNRNTEWRANLLAVGRTAAQMQNRSGLHHFKCPTTGATGKYLLGEQPKGWVFNLEADHRARR